MYKVGDIIEVVVTGISGYGIFVNVDNVYNGLIHISEISDLFVRDINDYVKKDEHILAEITDIDENSKQFKLSIKNINYSLIPKYGKIRDTKDGFKALQMKLPIWIREKNKELNEK